jgi:hypothetical protein
MRVVSSSITARPAGRDLSIIRAMTDIDTDTPGTVSKLQSLPDREFVKEFVSCVPRLTTGFDKILQHQLEPGRRRTHGLILHVCTSYYDNPTEQQGNAKQGHQRVDPRRRYSTHTYYLLYRKDHVCTTYSIGESPPPISIPRVSIITASPRTRAAAADDRLPHTCRKLHDSCSFPTSTTLCNLPVCTFFTLFPPNNNDNKVWHCID